MVTRRGLLAGVIGAILGFLGVTAVQERRTEPDEPVGTGPTGGTTTDGHVLRIPSAQSVSFIADREYEAIEWEPTGELEWETDAELTLV